MTTVLRIISSTLTAGVVIGLSVAPSTAQDPDLEPMALPCTGEAYLVGPAGAPRDIWHETQDGDRYHESSLFVVDVVAVPDGHTGPNYSGRLRFLHVANDGAAGAGHAVSSFQMTADLRGDDGSRIRAHSVAHIAATARPEDPASVIRVFFEHARCTDG